MSHTTSQCCSLTLTCPLSLTVDELIREVTINCAERGLLLLRVRDEMRMTIAAYQVCVFGGVVWWCGVAVAV